MAKRKEDLIKNKKTTKEWLPFDEVLDNGIIKKKKSYLKILKIIPINYDLKSNLEKEAVLNSYKLFLKTCDFDVQILVQSKKEDLSNYFYFLKEISKNEKNEKIINYTNEYINFIKTKSIENKSATKDFYIIIKYVNNLDSIDKEQNIDKEIHINNYLNECYFKIKETLSRCGNIVYDTNNKDEVEKILCNFFIDEKNNNKDWK